MTAESLAARELIEKYVIAMRDADFATMRAMMADDYVEDYPQTGERIRGADNVMAVRKHFPDLAVVWIGTSERGRVTRGTVYFAPMLPAPEWRAQWAEPIPRGER
jgi:ketosteroid isomerase-like protein